LWQKEYAFKKQYLEDTPFLKILLKILFFILKILLFKKMVHF